MAILPTCRAVWTTLADACLWNRTGVYIRLAGSLPKPLTDEKTPTIVEGRQAFDGDLRATSALGLGDGIVEHTSKWLQVSSVVN